MVGPKLSSCQFQRDVQKHLLPKKGLYYRRRSQGNTRISNGGCGTTHKFVDRFIYEGNKKRNLMQSQISRVLENVDYLNNVRVDSKTF